MMNLHFKRSICIHLLIVIIIYFTRNSCIKVNAASDGQYQYIFDNSGNELTVIQMKEDTGDIYLYGKHARSSATIAYRTFGYNFTLSDSNEDPRELGTGDYVYIERSVDDGGGRSPYSPDDYYVVDSYRLNGVQVTDAMIKLMRNQRNADGSKKYRNSLEINSALAQGVTVYMSNAFKVIQRSGGSGSEEDGYTEVGKLCHSYSEIIQEVRNVFGVDWSDNTQNVLHSYYDNPITIKLNPFTYNVVYIDQEDFKNKDFDKALEVAGEKLETHLGSQSEFELEDPKNILINGNTYEYAEKSSYQYDGSNTFHNAEYQDGIISVQHKEQKNATLYILVKSKGDNEVSIRYVDTEGKILEDGINGGKLILGKEYTHNPKDPISSNGAVYKYTDSYIYSYQEKSADKLKAVSGNGNPSFKITDIKEKTKVIMDIVYEKADETPVSTEESIKFMDAMADGLIKADQKGNELFDVTKGIPTTEKIYGLVHGKEYLIEAAFKKVEGSALIPIKVQKTYNLKWYEPVPDTLDEEGNIVTHSPILRSDTVKVEEDVFIERKYSYTEISSISYYKIKKAVLENDALPGEQLELYPAGYDVPALNYQHFESSDDILSNQHIIKPAQMDSGIDLGTQNLTGGSSRPAIPNEDFRAAVESKVDQLKVRNDQFEFNASIVLNAQYQDEKAPQMNVGAVKEPKKTLDNVLFKDKNEIPFNKKNGTYQSNGTLIYESVELFQSGNPDEMSFPIDINPVVVHTPVVCEAGIETNLKDNQMVNPDKSAASLVLGRPFKINMPTAGQHKNILGYGIRDYGKYIKERQVKFPFDVYRGSSGTGTFIPKNTWTSAGENTQFYLPAWVPEGKYTIQFYSSAINASAGSSEEILANLDLKNYIAMDTAKVEVSGRIYGLNLYDITDYPLWEEVFRASAGSTKVSGFQYTVGDKNQDGAGNGNDLKYTVPLINGSHPEYRNIGVLKTGYKVRFGLTTVGSMAGENDYIQIKPRFYYVDSQGKNRTEVDVYYTETIQGKPQILVKMGSSIDLDNEKSIWTGDPYLGIEEKALKQTAYFEGYDLANWKKQKLTAYTFTNILLPGSLRTYVGYQSSVPAGVTEKMIAQSVQKWYGEYYLPAEMHVVRKDFDVTGYAVDHGYIDYNESFWLTGGYVIVNFDITTIKDGKSHLSYANTANASNGYCNMWQREGFQKEKTDFKGNKFQFTYGDFVLYHTDKSVNDDYTSGGTH